MKLEPKRTAIISLDVQNDLVNNTQGVIESGMADRMAAVLGAGSRTRIRSATTSAIPAIDGGYPFYIKHISANETGQKSC